MNGDVSNLEVKTRVRMEIDAELLKTGNSLYDRELENKLQINRSRARREVLDATHINHNRYHVTGSLHCTE